MNRDRRTVRDCIDMTVELAKAMGLNHVKHPSLREPGDPNVAGLAYENFQGGMFLLMQVDERGHRYYPFGNVPMKYADFWLSGTFALACLDLAKRTAKFAQDQADRDTLAGEKNAAFVEKAARELEGIVYPVTQEEIEEETEN